MLEEHQLLRKTLRLVKLFEGFSEQDARDFLEWSARRDAQPGELVVKEGECGQDMYIVTAGTLKVVKSRHRLEEELAVLGPGDTFGEMALLDTSPRSASVRAATEARLLRFERKSLVKIPEVSLKLYRNIAAMMASRLRDTSDQMVLAKSALAAAEPDLEAEVPVMLFSGQVPRR